MKSPYCFIVNPLNNTRYSNTTKVGDKELVLNTSEEDFRFSERQAVVQETPIGYNGPIKAGDKLIVHHNVFKFYNDMQGRRQSGKSFLKDNTFLLDEEQFFAYKKEDGDWTAVDRYCFVSPLPKEDTYIYKPLTHEPLMGIMEIPSKSLLSEGVTKGKKVTFKPGSEYEFIVDGKLMYRQFDHKIVATL